MKTKTLFLMVAVAGLAATTFGADAARFRHRGYNKFTGRYPNYEYGHRKQTRTGGPAGGQTSGGGGS